MRCRPLAAPKALCLLCALCQRSWATSLHPPSAPLCGLCHRTISALWTLPAPPSFQYRGWGGGVAVALVAATVVAIIPLVLEVLEEEEDDDD